MRGYHHLNVIALHKSIKIVNDDLNPTQFAQRSEQMGSNLSLQEPRQVHLSFKRIELQR